MVSLENTFYITSTMAVTQKLEIE